MESGKKEKEVVATAIAEIYVYMIVYVRVYIHVRSGASEHGERESTRKGCIYRHYTSDVSVFI